MGATDPKKAEDNTIRKLYGLSIDKNSVQWPLTQKKMQKEINFFFQKLIYLKIFIIASG